MSDVFHDREGKHGPIFSDDLQVASDVMLCLGRAKQAFKELEGRGLIEIVASQSAFNRDYLSHFKDDHLKVASFVYDKVLTMIATQKVVVDKPESVTPHAD